MEFKQLISDFSMRHGVEYIDPEDDTVAFNVDGIPVLIAADEDEVAMISEIGEPPVEGRADFADLLHVGLDAVHQHALEVGLVHSLEGDFSGPDDQNILFVH